MSIQLFKQYTQAMADSDWNTIASMYAEAVSYTHLTLPTILRV